MAGCLEIYILFNNISVISGQLEDNNERLCATETSLQLERFLPLVGLKPRTTRSAGQH